MKPNNAASNASAVLRNESKISPATAVRVVGTNALREAKNSREFIDEAEALLGTPLEIIAGREEARLIYLRRFSHPGR